MLNLPQLTHVESSDPRLADSLRRIVDAVNTLGVGTGVDPAGATEAPTSIASLNVIAANGIFDIALTDNSPITRGISYFVESDITPGFNQPHVYSLGPSRNLRVSLGNLTLYWRAYSQYLGSDPSAPVAFGAPPTAVVGGGSAGPALQPSSGSGTAAGTGQQGGSGFGKSLFREAK
jgi:hypothetical protein